MTHDPLCQHPESVRRMLNPLICTYCQLIRAVRNDERMSSSQS